MTGITMRQANAAMIKEVKNYDPGEKVDLLNIMEPSLKIRCVVIGYGPRIRRLVNLSTGEILEIKNYRGFMYEVPMDDRSVFQEETEKEIQKAYKKEMKRHDKLRMA